MVEVEQTPTREKRKPNRRERRLATFGDPIRSEASTHAIEKRRRANRIAAKSRRRNRT